MGGKDPIEWCRERLKLRLKETLVESEPLIDVVTEGGEGYDRGCFGCNRQWEKAIHF
jgi:hypothetical protein